MATRLSSTLDTLDMDDRWSYNDLQSVIPVILSGFGARLELETFGVRGISRTDRRSKAPCLASTTISDIHSAKAHAVEKLWASAPKVDETTRGNL